MKIKNLTILVLVLAVLTVITWFFKRPSPPPGLDPRTGATLIDRETLVSAKRISLKDNGGEVTLVSDGESGAWRVVDYYDFPADFSKLSNLAGDLQEAVILRLVTRNPDRMERLDFGASAITVDTGGALPAFNLEIGKSAEGGGRFVRYQGEEKAYLTDLSLYLDATPKNWVQARLIEFGADDVARVEVGFDEEERSLVLNRDEAGADWQVASDHEADGAKTRELVSLINRLSSLRFTETDESMSDEAVAARANSRPLAVELFDGTRYTIEIGRRPVPPVPPAEDGVEEDPAAEPPPAPQPGPVYVFIESNRDDDAVNDLMVRRSFQVSDYTFTSLPADPTALLEPVPEPEPEITVNPTAEVVVPEATTAP